MLVCILLGVLLLGAWKAKGWWQRKRGEAAYIFNHPAVRLRGRRNHQVEEEDEPPLPIGDFLAQPIPPLPAQPSTGSNPIFHGNGLEFLELQEFNPANLLQVEEGKEETILWAHPNHTSDEGTEFVALQIGGE